MHPTSERSARELLAEAERLLEGNESLGENEFIRAPVIFVDGVKELLKALLERAVFDKALGT
ncbi:hypothetical protein KFS84_05660 [Xanthomonas translucens pv. graminis]|uniref:hypothetical protein n=1 Tax=Xanthomonas graminis TaxID=3390026 RepID=UPI00128F524C|nr:hypothetical protein [Xanthomonas translucens]UKE55285.1 hypothetical protein KFS84_05660 [Xanthomonas translucens pv. graminis]